MSLPITDNQVVARLKENNLACQTLALQNDSFILISQRGGRIFGPFLSPGSPSLLWINPAFAEPQAFQAFLNAGEWNLGGERVWIAPEVQYTFQDRNDPWGSYHLPDQMDPGQHLLDHLPVQHPGENAVTVADAVIDAAVRAGPEFLLHRFGAPAAHHGKQRAARPVDHLQQRLLILPGIR